MPHDRDTFLQIGSRKMGEEESNRKRKGPKENELIFIQSKRPLIEKMLGEDEVIVVRPECLAGFSQQVKVCRNGQRQRLEVENLLGEMDLDGEIMRG
jgi:hypothetical protein